MASNQMRMGDVYHLFDTGARALVAAVHAGDVNLSELADVTLARVAAAPRGALVHVEPDAVRAQLVALGRRLAQGEKPPLAGVPVAHKDLLDTRSFPTTYGNPAFARRPARDATAVARTVAAGAIQVGKANLHELAYGVTGANPHTGDVTNPARPDRIPGGSSSGSAAAVAAGAVLASLGTDTGGSLRIPAACCGVVGVKPTRGVVPTTGAFPLSWLQDTVGPLARSVADAALLLEVVAGPDGEDPACRPLPEGWELGVRPPSAAGLTVVVPLELWSGRIHPDVARACRGAITALEQAGADLRSASLPLYPDARHAQGVLLAAHALTVHRERFARDPDAFGPDVRARLKAATALDATAVVEAFRVRERWRAQVQGELGRDAVLCTPTIAFPPPEVGAETVTWPDGEEEVTPALTRLTGVWNLAGLPAVSVPAGRTDDGLPVGLQITAWDWGEPAALRAAAIVEAAVGTAP